MNEEDIKILENLKENVALFSGGWKPILKQEEKQSLENIIKAYKADKHILKNYVKVNKELHKDLKKLENRNKEQEKLIEREKNINKLLDNRLTDYIKYSIPKSKIKEKIEKLQREFDFYAGREHAEWQDGEFDGEQCDDIALQIRTLKELLEE